MSLSGGVVGFDFGTVNCIISQAKRGGIDTVLNENSKRMTACMVSFQGKQRFLGEQAVPLSKSNFKNTIHNIKLLLGRSFSDPEVQKEISQMPYPEAFVQLDGDNVGVKVMYNDEETVFSAEQITAMILNKLRATVRASKSHDLPADVVVSVPGHWNERQRIAMLDACKIAGFTPLRLLNDHTAAALSYGIYKSARNVFDAEKKEHVMFVDIGYSNTTIAVVAFVQGKLQVVSVAYDTQLGGRDFDKAIFDKFADEFLAKHKLDVRTNAKAILKLLDACEKAKQTMTPEGVNLAKVNVEFLMNEIDFRSELTLEDFEVMGQPLLARLKAVVERCMQNSKLSYEDIGSVEIIGGGTRPKIVKKALATYMKLDLEKPNYGLSTTMNLDESVARGCALNSAMLSPQFKVKEFNVYDLVNYPVRLTWDQSESQFSNSAEEEGGAEDEAHAEKSGQNSVLILRESDTVPNTKRVTFRRKEDFEIVASYEESCAKYLPKNFNLTLGRFKVCTGALKNAEQKTMIRVDFKINSSGCFQLSSAESLQEVQETKKEAESKEGKAEEKPQADGDKKENGEAETKTEEKKPEEEKQPEKPKKKTFTKTKLQVVSSYTYGLKPDVLKKCQEKEKTLCDVDHVIEMTGEARNQLEAYIYTFRDKVDGDLKDYITPKESTEFKSLLEKQETWLYDEGFDESRTEYQNRLSTLKEKGDRYELRLSQQTERPQAQRDLNQLINDLSAVINSTEEKYDHITEEERNKVRNVIEETQTWLKHQNMGQEKLNLYDDPVLTSTLINEQTGKLRAVGLPVVNKYRPPPKPPATASSEEKKGEKMEEDGKGSEDPKMDATDENGEPGVKEDMDID